MPSKVGARNGSRKSCANLLRRFKTSTTFAMTYRVTAFAPSPSQFASRFDSSSIRLRNEGDNDADDSTAILASSAIPFGLKIGRKLDRGSGCMIWKAVAVERSTFYT